MVARTGIMAPAGGRMTPAQVESLQRAIAAADWPAAEAMLRRAAGRRNAPASVLYNLGQVLARLGRARQSGLWYRKALAADPHHADAWCEYAAWLAVRGETGPALAAWERAIALRPDHRATLLGYARLALRAGLWTEARAAWLAVAGESDATGEAALALLRIALETGDPEAPALRRRLAARPELRPALLKTITRTARGAAPLSPVDL